MVSIIMPFKNTAKYLKECIESVLKQSYTKWELIAVNDGSTDKSVDIVKFYADKDQRIKYHVNAGQGIIPALQTAYQNAEGNFITRMDSDDIMTPQRLMYLVNNLESSGLGWVAVGQVKYFSKTGISDGYARYEKWLNNLTAAGTNYQEIYKECVIPSPCWMVFRDDFIKAGAFNANTYPEDYDLTFRFYQCKLKIIPCNKVLHLWRDYQSRTSRTHVHYAQNYFLELKTNYFLKLDYDPARPLVVWGAGFKGKAIAKILITRKIKFIWLCDNPKKIGKKIYTINLQHFSVVNQLTSPQSIITVANATAQIEIKNYLENLNHKAAHDYFMFC